MRCIFHGLSPFSTGSDYGVDFFKVVDEIEYPISVHNDDSRSSVSGMPPFDRFRMSHSQSSTEYQGNLTTQTFSKSVTLRGNHINISSVNLEIFLIYNLSSVNTYYLSQVLYTTSWFSMGYARNSSLTCIAQLLA